MAQAHNSPKEMAEGYRRALNMHIKAIESETGAMKYTLDAMVDRAPNGKAGVDLKHLAFSILHGTFNRDSPGGCSCEACTAIRSMIDELCKDEAAKFYDEHYPPPGGLL